jgi:hypothetical protein
MDRINPELHEYESDPFDFYIFINKSQSSTDLFQKTIKLPVHLRYHKTSDNSYSQFDLNRPKLFLNCQTPQINSNLQKKLAYCNNNDKTMCSWMEISFDLVITILFLVKQLFTIFQTCDQYGNATGLVLVLICRKYHSYFFCNFFKILTSWSRINIDSHSNTLNEINLIKKF